VGGGVEVESVPPPPQPARSMDAMKITVECAIFLTDIPILLVKFEVMPRFQEVSCNRKERTRLADFYLVNAFGLRTD
jgi:hypothetical protein